MSLQPLISPHPWSKGLGQSAKVDPTQKEKEELRTWLTDCIDKLQVQIDHFEADIESGLAATKKKKADRDVRG